MAKKTAPGDTVTVACKLPSGLQIKIPEHRIDLKLHGSNSPFAIAGHGMTRGVRADVWALVTDHFRTAKWFTNSAIFAMDDEQSASDKATERKNVMAGFEPIDPARPYDRPGASAIQPEGASDRGM